MTSKELKKQWALDNREKMLAYRKKWRDNNKLYTKAYQVMGMKRKEFDEIQKNK